MLSRTDEAYTGVIEYLSELAPRMNPAIVHCDFERAEINSWLRKFPNCRVAGCLWHYAVVSFE